jgi:hypothetical protein
MAKALIYIIDENEKRYRSGWFSNYRIRKIIYGKCSTPAYAESGLWFVTIPKGCSESEINEHSPKEAIFPRDEATFLVSEQFARQIILGDFGRDVEKWQQVAQKIIVGEWCPKLELLWKDVPIYEHKVPNGEIIKYGYCCTPESNPDRDLWFVAWRAKETDDFPTSNNTIILVVDEVCTKPDFLNHLGTNTEKWVDICWTAVNDLNPWHDYKTGFSMKFVENYRLERANGPSGTLSIDKKLRIYQDEFM